MKLSIKHEQELRGFTYPYGGFLIDELVSAYALITGGYNAQHNADDTHSTITATGSISERSRTTPMGEWITVPFTATDFTATGTMTWTVTAAQLLGLAYTLVGKTMTLAFYVNGSALGGAASSGLMIKVPDNFITASDYITAAVRINNGTNYAGIALTFVGQNTISIQNNAGTNFDVASALNVAGQISFPIK